MAWNKIGWEMIRWIRQDREKKKRNLRVPHML